MDSRVFHSFALYCICSSFKWWNNAPHFKEKKNNIFNYINATLVKIMIESDYPPKDIAAIIDHSSFDYSGICDFSNDN